MKTIASCLRKLADLITGPEITVILITETIGCCCEPNPLIGEPRVTRKKRSKEK